MADEETDIDVSSLAAYLATEFDVTLVDTEVLHDGLNLSLALSTDDGVRYVLRRPNKFRDTAAFNDVTQEYRTLELLAEADVPAPEPVLVCPDESVVGDPFLVMEHLDGEAVPLGEPLPERFRNPTAREQVGNDLVDVLAEIHSLDVGPFAEVLDRQTVQDEVTYATDRLDAATAVTGHEPPELREVAAWLERHAPDQAATTVVHGDFRPANVHFGGTDRPEIVGVLDWETAALGDPLVELGYLLLRWRDDGDPTPSLDDIEAENDEVIQDLRETNERGLAPFTNRAGSPSRRDLVERYEARTGIDFEHERFYRALAAFVLATVWADLHRHRVEAGEDSDWEPYIEYMSLLAHSIASGEHTI